MSELETRKINKEVITVLNETIKSSLKFEELTSKQLNITGIVGEVLAAEKCKLELVVDDINTGFDAIDENKKRVQIKTRRESLRKSDLLSKMLDRELKVNYDYALLVIVDNKYNLKEISRIEKEEVLKHFKNINSKRKKDNKKPRNTMSISQFKKYGKLIYELK